MKHLALASLTVLVAACGAPDAPPVPAEDMLDPAGGTDGPMADVPIGTKSLAGEWRLAGIDGAQPDGPSGQAISIDDRTITFENCQQVAWTYSYAENHFATERVRTTYSGEDPATVPPPPCAAPLPPPISDMVTAIDAATMVERTPENGLRLSGGGRSVTLFSQ